MQIEVALLISAITMAFGIYSGIASIKRHNKTDNKKESEQMTMMMVKLEGISEGIREIKNELSHEKEEIKQITERLIVVEQSVKSAHKRVNEINDKNAKIDKKTNKLKGCQ